MTTFQDIITLIQNGDPVNAGTINRALRQLDGNTKYVKQLLESALIGSTVFARSVVVETDALVGAPVYYNATNSRFERGLAATTLDSDGELQTADSAQVWGVVFTKQNSTSADILLTGYAQLDLSAVVSGTVSAGIYYLSGTEPGTLVQQTPPVTVPILQYDGDGGVFVNPRLYDAFMDHKHYKFDLACRPSGDYTPPPLGDRHVITNPDTSIEGWLPADDAIFAGKAPYGAAFGYNLSASELNNLWPPVPIANAYIEWDKGELKDYMGMGIPLGSDGLAVIDANGIWWMSDCYSDVPWPVDYSNAPISSSSSYSLECPRNLQMKLTLWFARMSFMTSGNVVTSLRVAEDSTGFLSLVCVQSGDAATTGDLEISFNSNYTVDTATDTTGHIVFKDLVNSQFKRGPVVDGITTSSSNVYLTSSDVDSGVYRGTVNIALITSALGGELPVELVRLNGVTEENYEDVLGLGFPVGRNSEYRARFEVPAALDGVTSLTMAIRLKFLALASGSLPNFTVSYRRVARPNPPATHTPLPTTDTALVLSMAAAQAPTPMVKDDYLEVSTATFTVAPGDTVLFTVTRNGLGGDGFAGDVHMIDQRPVIVGAV